MGPFLVTAMGEGASASDPSQQSWCARLPLGLGVSSSLLVQSTPAGRSSPNPSRRPPRELLARRCQWSDPSLFVLSSLADRARVGLFELLPAKTTRIGQ